MSSQLAQPGVSPELAQALAAVEGVEGWLSRDQARRLFERAGAVSQDGTIVEIGSFRGRSTIVLALGSARSVRVIAIDPHSGEDRGPREWHTSASVGKADRLAFADNLARAGVTERVRHVPLRSSDALGCVGEQIDLLYVDGAHGYRPARLDLAAWGERVKPGGTLLVHDAFSSVGVTLALFTELAAGGSFRYAGRSRSLAEYRRLAMPPHGGQRAVNVARQLAQLAWFTRNLAIKLAVVLRARAVAGWLGLPPGDEWPY